jgi:tetratricopeptide (TPR) repeat protein
MYRLAVDAESTRPAYDGGELDVAFDRLCEIAVQSGRYDEAADYRRIQSARIGRFRDAWPAPVFELFALHAQYGPLGGFASDLARFAEYCRFPQVLYAIAKLYERCGLPLAGLACADAAAVATLAPTNRLPVARFLVEHGWHDLAERELYALLSKPRAAAAAAEPGPKVEVNAHAVNAHLRLSALARQRGDDATAADHLEQVGLWLAANGGQLQRSSADRRAVSYDPRAEVAYLRFRAARSAGDDGAAEPHLAVLLELHPHSSDAVLDVIEYLRARGREQQAKRFFDRAHAASKALLEAEPDNPAFQNELAWLCARSGERPAEALELARRALADQPENPAYLDTAAEANFRCGNVDEAIRLESRALELEPGDEFMTEQLARFREHAGR